MTTFDRTMWVNAGHVRDYREQAERCVPDCHYRNERFTIDRGKKP